MSRLLAFVLLLMPGSEDYITVDEVVLKELTSIAIDLQILDDRETFTGIYDQTRVININLLRERLIELNGAPFIDDTNRFPPHEILKDLMQFNTEFSILLRHELNYTIQSDRYKNQLKCALEDLGHSYIFYSNMCKATDNAWYITERRAALKCALNIIGPEAYYNGYLPSNVPLYAFRP